MRTNKNLYLFAAALVAGTMGMTSCSNEVVPEVENNPTYNGESVKTQFALNIPAGKNTRMSGNATQQADGSFLGMQNIKLLPLFANVTEDTELKQIISLADFGSSDWESGKGNVKVYSDVNIPVGTNNFLFYAEAADDATLSTGETNRDFVQGALENNLAATDLVKVGGINFNLSKIASGFVYNEEIPAALTKIAQVEGWKTYATKPENVNTSLAKLYDRFTDLTAGSATSVNLVLETLEEALKKVTDEAELVAAIQAAVGEAKTAVANSQNFPKNYNLPDGVVELQWNDASGFSYRQEGTVIGSLTINPANICYPASLTYFVNTPLRATSSPTVDFPNSTNWIADGYWSGWNATAVDATTTGIALKNAINYAVANLQTTVQCKTNVLEDNAYAMTNHAEQNRKVIVPGTGFPVTGILIGGQPNSVDWQLLPAADDSRDMMVYDKNIADGMAAIVSGTGTPVSNYTLVLDNRKINTTGLNNAEKINIAVEFTNNTGTDFYGADGLIKAGATFYMLAQLDPTSKSDNSGEYKSVFQQDYKTVAKLTIASLKSAYNCIPDLRSTQLQLGMAVDLKWEAGLNFDIVIE